jgi:hypothetical protein
MKDVVLCEKEKTAILEDCLDDIDEDKKKGESKEQIFQKLHLKSFKLFEVAFENSDNKRVAEEKMNLFIKQLDIIDRVFVVIQFLTNVAKGE